MNLPVTVDPVEIGPANLQQYQDIYQQLTRRSEARVTFRSKRHRIKMEHIFTLHKDIERTANTMKLCENSMEIIQRSEDDTYERWSGMEKFRIQGPEVTQITTDIELVYNMLIQLPHAENPGTYRIKIRLRNELSSLKKHRENHDELNEINLIMMSAMATARWEIEFTDMSVARTFSRVISDWYDRLPEHPVPLAEKLSKRSRVYLSPVVRLLSSTIVAISAFGSAVWTGEPLDSGRIAVFIIMMYVVHFLTSPLIERLKHKMACIRTAASLNITSLDGELLDDEDKSRGQLARWIWGNALLPQLPAVVFFALNYLRSYF
jgi:hypothetical protein